MKKITFRFFLLLLAALLMLTACSVPTSTLSDTASGVSSPSVSSSPSEDASAESEVSSAVQTRIPASAEETENKGIYRIGADWKGISEQVSSQYYDGVLFVGVVGAGLDTFSETITVYSPSTDTVLGTLEVPEGNWLIGQLSEGGFYVINQLNGETTFYNSDTSVRGTCRLPAENGIAHLVVSTDGTWVMIGSSNTDLIAYEIATDTATLLRHDGRDWNWIVCRDNVFYIRGARDELFSYTPGDTQCAVASGYNAAQFRNAYRLVENDSKRYVLTDPANASNPIEFARSSADDQPVAASASVLLTTEFINGSNTVRCYDTEAGKVTEAVFAGSVRGACVMEDGLYLISVYTDDNTLLHYLIDTDALESTPLSVTESTEPVDPLEDVEMPEWGGTEEMAAFAQNLLDTYGVRVFYGDNAVDYGNFPGFTCVAVDDETNFKAMKSLKTALEWLPEGLVRDVCIGREFRIYLGTDLTSDSLPIAGCCFGGSDVALDAEYNSPFFESIFIHEFTHTMDRNITDYAWLNNWTQIMPEEVRSDCYYNNYTYISDGRYTPVGNGNTPIWFVDDYARTFEAEDRARIMEHLYLSSVGEKLDYTLEGHENILAKARYYALMLRSQFATCHNATEVLPWEVFLGPLDANEFSFAPSDSPLT